MGESWSDSGWQSRRAKVRVRDLHPRLERWSDSRFMSTRDLHSIREDKIQFREGVAVKWVIPPSTADIFRKSRINVELKGAIWLAHRMVRNPLPCID
jgi:hypothetical protein